MRIEEFHATKRFTRQLAALSAKKQEKIRQALRLALDGLDDPGLRLHELSPDPPNLDDRATPNGRIGGTGDAQKTSSLNRAAGAATTPAGCRSPRRSSVDQGSKVNVRAPTPYRRAALCEFTSA